jgi:hypothetical protein
MTTTVLRILWPLAAVLATLLTAFVFWIKIEERHIPVAILAWHAVIGLLVAVAYALRHLELKRTVGSPADARRLILVALCIWAAVSLLLAGLHRVRIEASSRAGQDAGTRSVMKATLAAVQMYAEDFGHIPTEQEGLHILIRNSRNKNYLFGPEIPRDAWGNPLRYSVKNGRPIVWSVGQDGKPDTRDDIISKGVVSPPQTADRR